MGNCVKVVKPGKMLFFSPAPTKAFDTFKVLQTWIKTVARAGSIFSPRTCTADVTVCYYGRREASGGPAVLY